jgi:3-oxo-5-alpha-steroid 4-dehydrogenase 1
MAPIHAFVWLAALAFQLANGISIGSWLGAYGPTTAAEWAVRSSEWQVWLGMAIWAAGLAGNIWHDDILRDIRRPKAKDNGGASATTKITTKEGKVYEMPERGLFKYILYPHYFSEWIEWCGFWLVGGIACVPARNFVLNEVTTMLPRAWNGWHWYVEKFGKDKVGSRKVVIPWLV